MFSPEFAFEHFFCPMYPSNPQYTTIFNIPDQGCSSEPIIEGGCGQGSSKIHIPLKFSVKNFRAQV